MKVESGYIYSEGTRLKSVGIAVALLSLAAFTVGLVLKDSHTLLAAILVVSGVLGASGFGFGIWLAGAMTALRLDRELLTVSSENLRLEDLEVDFGVRRFSELNDVEKARVRRTGRSLSGARLVGPRLQPRMSHLLGLTLMTIRVDGLYRVFAAHHSRRLIAAVERALRERAVGYVPVNPDQLVISELRLPEKD
jgi:hypothetical protein